MSEVPTDPDPSPKPQEIRPPEPDASVPTVPRPAIHPMYQSPQAPPTSDADGRPVVNLNTASSTGQYPASRMLEEGASAEWGGGEATNTSGSRQGVPPEIARLPWNWGAFLVTPAWTLCNGVPLLGYAWILLMLVAVLSAIALPGVAKLAVCLLFMAVSVAVGVIAGLRGSAMSWENRRFDDLGDYFAVQRSWSAGGFLAAGLLVAVVAFTAGVIRATQAGRTVDTTAVVAPSVQSRPLSQSPQFNYPGSTAPVPSQPFNAAQPASPVAQMPTVIRSGGATNPPMTAPATPAPSSPVDEPINSDGDSQTPAAVGPSAFPVAPATAPAYPSQQPAAAPRTPSSPAAAPSQPSTTSTGQVEYGGPPPQ